MADQIRTDETSTVDGAADARPKRRPEWIKVRAPSGETYEMVRGLMRSKQLHTVCEEAMCPNLGECWGAGTATFLMLGDTCTRSCRFCDIKTGRPAPLDWQEPNRVAQSVKAMNLRHVVITSVNRDERARRRRTDLRHGHPAHTADNSRGAASKCSSRTSRGSRDALKMSWTPSRRFLNHNVETVRAHSFRQVQHHRITTSGPRRRCAMPKRWTRWR